MAIANYPAFFTADGKGQQLSILGHIAQEKITAQQSGGAYYVFDLISPPGLGIPPHVHRMEDEVIYIVEGTFDVFLDGKNSTAGAGSTLNFARGTPHGFTNTGSTPGKTIWFVAPGESFQSFFRELAKVPPGPPDVPMLADLLGRYGMDFLPPPD